jgi:tetratricopeptide (TPR) repeat protein
MADVFISYASEDRNRVRPLAEALAARGFSVWWDRALAAGQDYASVIEQELRAARVVIVVWTEGSAASTFVRDEAGRARDDGRLVPVLLDKVDIPLGFGSFQAEDFSRWNGGSAAPQMQLLEEAVRAKLEGRSIDGAAVARKRRRLMSRIRIVSLLTVVAAIVAIAAGLNSILGEPDPPPTDIRVELLRLLEQGTLTPEQAIELAQILESGALGEPTQLAANETEASAPGALAPGGASRGDSVELVSVTEGEFDAAARETFREASAQLLRHPDSGVRQAVLDMANDEKRDAAMQTLWAFARSDAADEQTRLRIYKLCGAVGETNDDPLGQRALEIVASVQPEDADAWRMLSRSYRRTNDPRAAEAAALVSQGVEAQQQGETANAERAYQRALPNLQNPSARAAVESELGSIAERRNDWTTATQRHAEAYRLREAAEASTPAPVAQANLQTDASNLTRALDRSGRTEEACEQLRQAQEAHQVEAEDQALAERCERVYSVRVLPRAELQRQRVLEAAPVEQRAVTPQE